MGGGPGRALPGLDGQLNRAGSFPLRQGQRADPGQQRWVGGVGGIRREHRGQLSRVRLEGQRSAQAEAAREPFKHRWQHAERGVVSQ